MQTFYGAKPSEIGYLSAVISGIQGQLDNITSTYLLSRIASSAYQQIGNYQPTGSYLLSQDVLQYLTISSAILNYQSATNANTNNTYFHNSINTLPSSVYNLNSINLNNLAYQTSISSIIYTQYTRQSLLNASLMNYQP